MSRNILVINANPKIDSFCHAISERYQRAAAPRHQVKVVQLSELQFDPNFDFSAQLHIDESQSLNKHNNALEADIVDFQQALLWAQHIVIVCPVWWGVMPAKFKGLLDRALLSGFAYRYESGNLLQQKLLTGRTAELFITLDTPVFWYKWLQGRPIYSQLKHTVLGFCGIKTVASQYFAPVIHSTSEKRETWLAKVERRARAI